MCVIDLVHAQFIIILYVLVHAQFILLTYYLCPNVFETAIPFDYLLTYCCSKAYWNLCIKMVEWIRFGTMGCIEAQRAYC